MSSPLPTPPPAARRPPVPAWVSIGLVTAAVAGLGFVLCGPFAARVPAEDVVLPVAPPGLGPLSRAGVPRADGFADPSTAPCAAATGVVVAVSVGSRLEAGGTGQVVLLHRIAREGGSPPSYFHSFYPVGSPTLAVGDLVARGQHLARQLHGEVQVARIQLRKNPGKTADQKISVKELLRLHPEFASPPYALPPVPSGGGTTSLIFQNQ